MGAQQKGEASFYLRWLDFNENRQKIVDLRNQVFNEEQKLGDFLVEGEDDPDGLHLGMFENGNLISLITVYIFEKGHARLQLYSIPRVEKRVVQFGRRVDDPKYRRNKFAAFLVAVAYKSLYELIQFDAVFFLMYGIHRQLAPVYRRLYLTHNQYEVSTKHGNALVLLQDSPEVFAKGYIMQRYLVEKYTNEYGFNLPNLKDHILKYTNLKQILSKTKPDKNIYLEAMSIADEMPRLSAQSRLLFMSKRNYFSALAETENGLDILDAGCGPGVFLSSISHLPNLSKSRFTGIDLSEIMITYASLTNPKLNWIKGNVYDLPFETNRFDIVHASFLMIHLYTHGDALREFYRVLKPGGKLIVTDVNDDSFEGPGILKRMILKHAQVYEGNRKILNILPQIAEPIGFHLKSEEKVTVRNDGDENKVVLDEEEAHIDKYMMWAMFSFIEQDAFMKEIYNKAAEYYLKYFPKISIGIYTQIYEKPG